MQRATQGIDAKFTPYNINIGLYPYASSIRQKCLVILYITSLFIHHKVKSGILAAGIIITSKTTVIHDFTKRKGILQYCIPINPVVP